MADKIIAIFLTMSIFIMIALAVMLGNATNTYYSNAKEQYLSQNKVVVNNKDINTIQMTGLQIKNSLEYINRDNNTNYSNGYYKNMKFKLNNSSTTINNLVSGLVDTQTYTLAYESDTVLIK